MTTEREIFVRLLNEGIDSVWRPTQAIALGSNKFKILPPSNYDPEDEEWEFLPGSIVKAEMRLLSKGEVLVAVEQIKE